MHNGGRKAIYLISGPCGAGKSTVAKELSRLLQPAVCIVGDTLNHIFEEGYEPPWAERLALTWENFLSLTRNLVCHEFNVVIDFVVEDELNWFCRHVSNLNIEVSYVVLRADEQTLIERLRQRGDPDLVDRSLFLLQKIENAVLNQGFIYDTTHKKPTEIARDIFASQQFRLPNS